MKLLFGALISCSIIAVLVLSNEDETRATAPVSVANSDAQYPVTPVDSARYSTAAKPTRGIAEDSWLPYTSAYGPLPDSLRDSRLELVPTTDSSGYLIVNSDLKDVFDFFLSGNSEESIDTIRARIDEFLNYHLEEPALAESQSVLAQYLNLKLALFEFESSRSDTLSTMLANGSLQQDPASYLRLLQEQLEARTELRSQHLGTDVHEAFYADDEYYDQQTLNRMQIQANTDLSETEKADQLAAINSGSAHESTSQQLEQLKSRTETLREAGASEQDIHAIRSASYGIEAADRFARLDAERAQWRARVDSYLAERALILNTSGLSMEDRQAQVNHLRNSHFDDRERIRVGVYERSAEG